MLFAAVFRIDNFLPEAAQSNEDFIRLLIWHCCIKFALHDQERCLDSIEIKDRRVFDVSVTELPWSSAHSSLTRFGPADRPTRSCVIHNSVVTDQISRTCAVHGSFKSG